MAGPEKLYFQGHELVGLLLRNLIWLTMAKVSCIPVHAFWVRYQKRRHRVTLLGLIGATVSIVATLAPCIYGSAFVDSVWLCEKKVIHWWDFLQVIATCIMLLHLFFKARLVLAKVPDSRKWTVVQVLNLAILPVLPLLMAAVIVTTTPVLEYDREFQKPVCMLLMNQFVFLGLQAAIIVANMMSCALFFDGLMELLTGGVLELTRWQRVKASVNLLLRGERALKDLERAHRDITRVSIGSLESYSSRPSIKLFQTAKIKAARRAFYALSADASLMMVLTGIWMGLADAGLYILRILIPALSWTFTVIACPMPADPNVRPPVQDLDERRDERLEGPPILDDSLASGEGLSRMGDVTFDIYDSTHGPSISSQSSRSCDPAFAQLSGDSSRLRGHPSGAAQRSREDEIDIALFGQVCRLDGR